MASAVAEVQTFRPNHQLPQEIGMFSLGNGVLYVEMTPQLSEEIQPSESLTEFERRIFLYAAAGKTIEDVASSTPYSQDQVKEARDGIVDKYGVRKMGPALNKGILNEDLPFSIPDGPKLSVGSPKLVIMANIALGRSTGIISKNLGIHPKFGKVKKWNLFDMLNVRGEAEAVTQMHLQGYIQKI